jgi:hypothetical protein
MHRLRKQPRKSAGERGTCGESESQAHTPQVPANEGHRALKSRLQAARQLKAQSRKGQTEEKNYKKRNLLRCPDRPLCECGSTAPVRP